MSSTSADKQTPTFANGKICYIEIPARSAADSAAFYERVFGWNIRRRRDGSLAFDDGVNEVSGTWIEGRAPNEGSGLYIYIMVADAAATVEALCAAGGEIVKPIDPELEDIFALFRDPAGNVLGVYEQPGLD